MKKTLIFLSMVLLGACSSRVAGIATIIPEEIKIPDNMSIYELPRKRVTVSDTTNVVVILPLRIPRLDTLTNAALKEGKGNALTNITIYNHYYWFLFWGWWTQEMTADVITIPTKGNQR